MRKQKLTRIERKKVLSKLLRLLAWLLWSQRSFDVFEGHLNVFENESLSTEKRREAAQKIDRMIYRRLKRHEQIK